MHILQSKHTKLSKVDIEDLLKKYNLSLMQLPKIRLKDSCIPEGCEIGDVIKIERKEGDKKVEYFRVIVK
jgi:DNA-directed RNA polymerase subunit H (RpoH/RPB5)